MTERDLCVKVYESPCAGTSDVQRLGPANEFLIQSQASVAADLEHVSIR